MFAWPKVIKKPKGKRVLVLAPHMDDEIIGCGGVIRKHTQDRDDVTVIYFTAGDKGNSSLKSDQALSEIRKEETRAANQVLGIQHAYFLDYPDAMDGVWEDDGRLRELLTVIKPDLIYLPPYYDLHTDHRKTNWLFREVAQGQYTGTLCIYEVWTPVNPNRIVNITQQMEDKLEAMRLCKSQTDTLDYVTFAKSLNQYRSKFALSPMVEFAEAFYMISAEEYFSKFKTNEFDWHLN